MTKNKAMQRAKAMQAKMKTKGWRIEVHENFGWHYSIRKGWITLYESTCDGFPSTYWTLMSNMRGAGETFLLVPDRHTRRQKDPNKAVEAQLKVAKAHLKKIQDAVQLSGR